MQHKADAGCRRDSTNWPWPSDRAEVEAPACPWSPQCNNAGGLSCCLTAVQNRLSAVHPSSIARDQRADHTTLDRQVVVAGEEVRRRVAHDRPRSRIRSNRTGSRRRARSHWDVMTVGPTSPTRSTSAEPHHGQITRSEAWALWGTRRRRRPRHRGRVWGPAAGPRGVRRRTMRSPTARKAWSDGHNQSRTSNGQPATEAVR